ncbi:MAG TPA: hypothetical protein VGK32_18075 [Vicinamibacterales bacterium]|jgi:type II secretory pathway pseudopilin PulG
MPPALAADHPARPAPPRPATAGFSIIELLVVVGLIAVVTGIAVLMMPGTVRSSKADSALTVLTGTLRKARDRAVSERRDMEVRFVGTNEIDIYRWEVPSGTTLVSRTVLEDGARFLLYSALPDTPDGFGKTSSVCFGSATALVFRSEGTFTDNNANLDPISGTVFIGMDDDTVSGRAATIFGPTALVRGYRWDGRQWSE